MRVVRAQVETARCGTRPGLILSLRDDGGRVGRGEATPLPGYSPDDLPAAHAALLDLVGHLPAQVDEDPAGVGAIVGALPARVPSARFAVETALLDLVAQREDVSLATLLRGGPAPHLVRLAAVVFSPSADDALAEAERLFARGVRTFKRKVRGRAFDDECRVLGALRAHFGDAVELRVDANGSWSLEDAPRKLAALAPFGVALVEEPVRGRALCALGSVAVPWAADESLRDPALAPQLLVQPSCVGFVLKPMLLGGVGRCLALAELADQYDRDVVVTHLFDGPVALAACEALAAALPRAPLACGLDAAHLAARDAPAATLHRPEAHP